MGNYYCLMSGLPDVTLDSTKTDVSIASLREELELTLSEKDKKIMYYFFLENDCANIVKLLKNPNAEIDCNGNMTMEQYADLITSAKEMNFNVHRYPAFMSEFVRHYTYNKDKEGYFPEDDILYLFYQYAIKTCPSKMVRKWYKLNLDIANILTAFLARKNGWAVANFIQGNDNVTEMILTNNTKDFNLTTEYDYVADLMKIVDCEDPVEKEKKIDAFKWLWLEESTFFNIFSIDAVFAYFCKLSMLARWEKLDVEKGQETFRQIIENLRGEARVPQEFQTKALYNKSEAAYNKSEK
ncbi:MAG: DUF2764 family protein [Bacteroidaceae bacterium]|nr:DUF2764 family protein [Bacteroidaceae bacterium]MDO5482441.1 DUF2764 family protein [Bacteroidaceae bacterium]